MFTLPFYFDSEQMRFQAISLFVGLVVAIWIYTRPREHFIKQLMWYMVISRTESFAWLLGRHARPNYRHAPLVGRILFWLLAIPLAGGFLFSIAALCGITESASPPPGPPTPVFDSGKFEIVTQGHTIYARPKPAVPSTNAP